MSGKVIVKCVTDVVTVRHHFFDAAEPFFHQRQHARAVRATFLNAFRSAAVFAPSCACSLVLAVCAVEASVRMIRDLLVDPVPSAFHLIRLAARAQSSSLLRRSCISFL